MPKTSMEKHNKMFRKFHILFLVCVIGCIFHLTHGFAEDVDDNPAIPEADFVFPTPEGEGYLQDILEYQRVPQQIIDTADFEKMRDLAKNSQDYKLGQKVGLIVTRTRNNPKQGYLCTGFLVGPDLFMTNHHCVYDGQGLLPFEKTAIYMNYYQDLSVDSTAGGVTAGVSEVLHAHARKDYALLRLDKPIGNTYGWLKLDTKTAVNTSQSVKIIQHPQGRSKEIVRKNSQIAGIIAQAPFMVAYLADTQKGASGSPVFLKNGTGVIAIHHSAWSDASYNPLFNAGSLMSHIVPEIRQWLPGGATVDPPTPPDLVVVAPRIREETLRPGESFTLSATVRNQGDTASEATTLQFYRSADSTITTSDIEVGKAVVKALDASDTSKASLTLAAPDSLGTYYYGACVAAVADEDATDNNCSAVMLITVSTVPDLVVASPRVSERTLRPGESFTLSATVRNQGDAASAATTLQFYRSTDTTITISDVEVGRRRVKALEASDTSKASLTLAAPDSLGTYYYGACVAAVADEDATDNNCSAAIRLTVSVGFTPRTIVNPTLEVGSPVSLTLPVATGGTEPYSYTLSPVPEGLDFDAETRELSGIPTSVGITEATYTATDATGASAALIFTIEVVVAGRLDVDGDGQVTVIDLAMVALSYETQVPDGISFPADVNADGVVNILDLTAVAQRIDTQDTPNRLSLEAVESALGAVIAQAADLEVIAEAPMRKGHGQILPRGVVYSNVANALVDARHLGHSVHAVLKKLLQLLTEITTTPDTTALLPNYPNPFNPETWIPYHLAKAANVTLTLYDMRGVAVRQLMLGHQPAGIYQTKHRAAYWDGRNQHGEPVASGIYFYTLTAGKFTATRKLLIIK